MGLFDKLKQLRNLDISIAEKHQLIDSTEVKLQRLKEDIEEANTDAIKAKENRDAEIQKTEQAQQAIIEKYKTEIEQYKPEQETQQERLTELTKKAIETEHKFNLFNDKLKLARRLYKKITVALEDTSTPLDDDTIRSLDLLAPSVEIPLHSYDIKDLRAIARQTEKVIDETLKRYEKRYTTKTNKALYQLMVLALRSELQNMLSALKFSTLEKCRMALNTMIHKYRAIAADGNKTILPTINSFIDEISVLFHRLIDVEYEYYIRKEQAKAEQQALKEQMRQEAEERKRLEEERKQIEKEEQKYNDRINELNEQISECSDKDKLEQLLVRIEELKAQLLGVQEKKDEIIKLQNGKAGSVYVISNLGSFGEDVFKIGMTRRLDPMERIKELGSASVPFAFDVHSFIFSDNAVDLEHNLHLRLNQNRINKINLRKEFFRISIDELEALVQEIDPTAEFNKAMIATEFRQSISNDSEQ